MSSLSNARLGSETSMLKTVAFRISFLMRASASSSTTSKEVSYASCFSHKNVGPCNQFDLIKFDTDKPRLAASLGLL